MTKPRKGLLSLLLIPNESFITITDEIKVQTITIKQTRVSYQNQFGYTTNPCVYVDLPFLTNQSIVHNQPKTMIPLMSEEWTSTVSCPNASFTLSTKIPRKIYYTICNELGLPTSTVAFVQLLLEYEIGS